MDLPVEPVMTLRPGTDTMRRDARLRRALFFGLTLATSWFASLLMLDILEANGLTLLERAGLVLFFALFTWISGAFWTAVVGFVVRAAGGDPAVLSPESVRGRPLHTRTAIVMPVCNEDPARVAAGIDAIWSSLAAEPEQHAFDLFILSDTRRPEIAAAEERVWRELVARHGAAGRIFYRRRRNNTGRKAGNIADFVRSWGGAYEFMIVLDADSVMPGRTLVTLARLMEAHPRVGIIQTLPMPAGRETLFARLVQFAARLNGPMLASGLAFWQLGESNYWGHNAILRVRPFAECCALPRLPGAPPLGGEVLSHDFVEAAFMRRAGYEVWLVPDVGESWEEVPSNVVDFAARDRRWAQGNLQHMKVLPLRGLHWLSRIHLLTGIASYVTSPAWLAVLVLSSILTCMAAIRGHQYFEPGAYMLFPNWPESRAGEIVSLLTVTIVVLLLPKLLGATLALTDRYLRRGFGGARRLLQSLLIEQLFSMLLAPSMMVFHTTFVVRTLLGYPVNWDAQPRDDRGVTYAEAFARHKWHVLLGIAWGTTILLTAPQFIWWMLPVLAGLLISVPLTVWTSRKDLGQLARRRGLLLTPEETASPPELAAVVQSPFLQSSDRADVAASDAAVVDAPRVPAAAPMRMEPLPLEYLFRGRTPVTDARHVA